jgi:hypothetical protein
VAGTEDYTSFLTPPPQPLGYRQGTVVAWNVSTGTNTIRVAETDFVNLPVITNADLLNLRPGDVVAIIKYNDSYAILGKIKGAPTGTLWMPVPLYPQFAPLTALGTASYAQVPAGTLVSWEGRIYLTHHSFIQVDGIWGQSSGSNTTTFAVEVAGVRVGSWTLTGLDVSNRGPFDISFARDQEFVKVEVKIISSVGSGNVAIQVLACYLR